MVFYEWSFVKHNALFVLLVLIAPALVMACFKFFFDSALQFGFKNKFTSLDAFIDMSKIPQGVVMLELGPAKYDYISTSVIESILADNKRLADAHVISGFAPENLRTRLFDNMTQVQINKLAILVDEIQVK